jgi:hypothetical protein
MSIIKRRYTANFTTIDNRLFEDERLAADEVGILAYLRSRPHDWEVRRPALARRWDMGRDAIKRVIASLVRTGWCIARKDRRPDGTFYMIYEIRDEPGPTLTDEEVRRALSLVSSEAASDENDVISSPNIAGEQHGEAAEPPTGYPSLADPPPADPPLAYIDIQNKDLPRKDSTKIPERESARAREKHLLNLAAFKRRWPDVANDDQTRLDRAWFGLSNEEGEAALAGMAAFFEGMKRRKKTHPPASWRYVEEKRWTLLDAEAAQAAMPAQFAGQSREGRAIAVLFDLAGKADLFRKAICRNGVVYWRTEITPQLLALADLKPRADWRHTLTFQQAGAWNSFIGDRLGELTHVRLVEGSAAPEPWPPKKDGTWSPAPERLASDEDLDAFANEGQ